MQNLLRDELIRRLSPEASRSAASMVSMPRPETEDELSDFLWRTLEIRIPRVPVKPGHTAPWKAFCDAYFARYPVCVWLGARGLAGKTYMLAVLGWCEAVTLRANVSILGGSSDQSEKVLEYLTDFWLRPTAPQAALEDEPSARRVKLVWGNKIRALAASQRAARGGHPQRLRLDEVDEMDWKLLKAVRGQPMGSADVPSQTVMSSTHHNPDGTMTKILKEAAEKGWPVYQWGYQETLEPHGWLSQFQLQRSKQTMSADTWNVEVEMNEPSAEGRAIVTDKVEAMFVGEKIKAEENHDYIFEEPVLPVVVDGREIDRATYATGVDWGQTSDYSEFCTWRTDVRPLRLVAYRFMRRRPYPEMVAKLDDRLRAYPGQCCHDYTGVGRVGEFLDAGDIEDVTMVGRVREDLFRDYVLAVERDEVRAPRIDRLYEAHKYVRVRDLYARKHGDDEPKGHPPDCFVAMAMANKAAGQGPIRVLFAETPKQAAVASAQRALDKAAVFFGQNGKGEGHEDRP